MTKYRREGELHCGVKGDIENNLFAHPKWSVFIEEHCADLLILHNSSGFLAATELETTPRNVLRNISRNLSNGCLAVATVSLQERYHRQICNKIRKHYPELFGTHLQVFPYDAEGLQQLVHWIEELAISHARMDSSGAAKTEQNT